MRLSVVNRLIILALLPAVLFASGCGVRTAASRQKVANDLRQIGLAYHNYNNERMKGPDRAEDLQPFLRDAPPDVYQSLASGRYVFIYGVKLTDMQAGPATTVVGYEKDAPTQGGNVLMGDSTVQYVTADQFKKLNQAKPKATTAEQPTPPSSKGGTQP
jgi:hypothetical protein